MVQVALQRFEDEVSQKQCKAEGPVAVAVIPPPDIMPFARRQPRSAARLNDDWSPLSATQERITFWRALNIQSCGAKPMPESCWCRSA